MLHLKVLGTLSLFDGSQPVPPEARQKRRIALLALLAVAGSRGISRDRLQSYLWPESSADRARHALDQLVYAARRSLGLNPILAEGRDLRLDTSIVETDLCRFGEAMAANRLSDAVALYGGPLLTEST
jgi:DNA-binding transcriptional activator of the SARP family